MKGLERYKLNIKSNNRKTILVVFYAILVFLIIFTTACSQKEPGNIYLQSAFFYKETGEPVSNITSLEIDHYEINGHPFQSFPYLWEGIEENPSFIINVVAKNAIGVDVAFCNGVVNVVAGQTSPVACVFAVHTFESAWSYNGDYHWHASTCGHDVVMNLSEHRFGVKTTYYSSKPTQSSEGTVACRCLTCGAVVTAPLAAGYAIKDKGPTGGYIVYDCDMDNDFGNWDGLKSSECGWRYIEAAPADLVLIAGSPSVDSSDINYSSGQNKFVYGYYRLSSDSENLFTEGIHGEVGTGNSDTERLVTTRGNAAYTEKTGTTTTENYAARLCAELEYTVGGKTYDDWFLPSLPEVELLFWNLRSYGLGSFANEYYWSSTETPSVGYAYNEDFGDDRGGICFEECKTLRRVRPIRIF